MLRKSHWAGWGVLVLLLGGALARGGEAPPGELKLTTERVVVFKDGYCLIVKRAVGKANERGEVWTEQVPDAAVLGCFWATPAKTERLLQLTAGVETTSEETKTEATCTRPLEVLLANRGKTCTVELNDGKTTLTGEIREVLAEPTPTWVPAPVAAGQPAGYPPGYAYSGVSSRWAVAPSAPVALTTVEVRPPAAGSFFILRAEGRDNLVSVGEIRRLSLAEMTLKTERTTRTTRTTKRLTFRFEKAAGEKELLIIYFTPGLRWIPTYRVELAAEEAPKKEARLELQAEFLNEVEDLTDVPLDLVVGVPNFRFRSLISPLSLERTMRNALQEAAPQLMGQQSAFSNAMFSQRGGEWRGGAPEALPEAAGLNLPAELTAAGAQDLFVYHLQRLTLRKGQRAALPIFEATAPYRDVYTWELRLRRQGQEATPEGTTLASPLALSTNQVWHQVELTNNTPQPWTTGAALLMQGTQPLAQELLTYTSPGGTLRLPVTVAVDLRGTFGEQETARTLKALTWQGHQYARVEKEGKLNLANLKKLPVAVEITCQMAGCADQASDKGAITLGAFEPGDWQNYQGHTEVNQHSVVVWRATVKPGETFAPTVNYHYFFRHY